MCTLKAAVQQTFHLERSSLLSFSTDEAMCTLKAAVQQTFHLERSSLLSFSTDEASVFLSLVWPRSQALAQLLIACSTISSLAVVLQAAGQEASMYMCVRIL